MAIFFFAFAMLVVFALGLATLIYPKKIHHFFTEMNDCAPYFPPWMIDSSFWLNVLKTRILGLIFMAFSIFALSRAAIEIANPHMPSRVPISTSR